MFLPSYHWAARGDETLDTQGPFVLGSAFRWPAILVANNSYLVCSGWFALPCPGMPQAALGEASWTHLSVSGAGLVRL